MNEREIRERQVLVELMRRKGEWIHGAELANEEVGGSEGLRRLRAWRKRGYVIEKRRAPGSRTAYEYRLVAEPKRIVKRRKRRD